MGRFARRPRLGTPRASAAPRKPPAVEGNLGIPQWTELLKEFPDYVQAYVERGILLYRTGRYDNALFDFNAALKLEPHQTKALFYRGCSFLAYKRWKEAVADFKKCSGNAEARFFTAVALVELNDIDGALQQLDQTIAAKPEHARALALRGELRVRRKDLDGALSDLNQAAALDADHAGALATRAQVHLAKGN